MTINNVRVFLNSDPENRVKAIATVLLNKKLLLQSVRIVEDEDEATGEPYLRVFYPDQRLADGKFRRCVSPGENFRSELDAAVLNAYEQVLADPSEKTVVLSDDEADFEITDMKVYPISSNDETPNPLLAKVGIQLDGCMWLRGMVLVSRDEDPRILWMPSRISSNDRRINFYQFTDRNLRNEIRDRVSDAYDDLPEE